MNEKLGFTGASNLTHLQPDYDYLRAITPQSLYFLKVAQFQFKQREWPWKVGIRNRSVSLFSELFLKKLLQTGFNTKTLVYYFKELFVH